jgi:xanthine/uracil/vitamin C permease (AzgA family)
MATWRGRIATFTAAVLVVTGAVSIVWGVVVGLLADWPTALAATVGLASLVLLIGNLRELRG